MHETEMGFLCPTFLVFVNAFNTEFAVNSYTSCLLFCFHNLFCSSLSNFFSGVKRQKTAGTSARPEEIKRIWAGMMKTKLRIAFNNFVKLKSFRYKMAVSQSENVHASSKFCILKSALLLKVEWNICIRVTFGREKNENYSAIFAWTVSTSRDAI